MNKNGKSKYIKQILKLSPLVGLVLVMLISSAASTVLAQSGAKVELLIAFSRQPGPAEQALVRGVGGDIKYTYHLVPAIAASVPEAAIEGLLKNPVVTGIDPDLKVQVVDAELDNTWGVKRIGAGAVHAGGNMGAGVKVAVLDTGIDTDHPDLNYDPTCSASFVASEPTIEDGHSHGTHTAGTVAALDNDTGVVGVAPEVTLCIYKVFDSSGNSNYSDIAAAIERAVDDGVQVTNNSYGGSGDPGPTIKAAFDNAAAAGVLHVAAAGNNGNFFGTGQNCIYPARWDSVMATAATMQDDSRAFFSSTCPEVELAAPGFQINSTWPGGGYGLKDGTSMASPHVAGTAALVLAANPGWSNDAVRTQLQSTANDLGNAGRDTWYGYGLVDADEAAALPNNPPQANAGIDQTVGEGVVVTLDGTGSSDGDDDPLTYSWTQTAGLAVTLSDSTSPTPSFNSPAVVADTLLTFELAVSDGTANDTDIVNVTVLNDVNEAPVANAGENQSVTETNPVTLDGTGSYDPNDDPLTYSWAQASGPAIALNDSTSPMPSFTAPEVTAVTDLTFELAVHDGDLTSSPDTVVVTVNPVPTPDIMHVGNLDGASTSNGKNWQAQVTITVHDGSHQAVADATVNGTWSGGWSGPSICTTGTTGTCAVTSGDIPKKDNSSIFTVSSVDHASFTYNAADKHDPEGNSNGTAIQVNKDGTTSDPGAPVNQSPVASFTASCSDLTCSFDASGSSDSDGSIVSYAWDFGDGNSDSGVTPPSHTYAAAGSYSVALTVTDNSGASDTDTQNVTVSDGSGGLTLTASGYKVKGVQHVDLTWSGAGSSEVDIYRDGVQIGTTANDGFYTDNIGNKGGGAYTYQLCEAGTTTCSNEAAVTF